MSAVLERLRQIWTPDSDVEEIVRDLDPQTELDSMIRDLLCRIICQKGPMTLDYSGDNPPGNLRWEIVHHEPRPGIVGRREISIWVEDV